ncbi:hypothetical protein Y032_0420g1143 [Ancylostoma ceylanicum]|uniref:Uncharacterized protein n=1 Tax=Ancylostoma ceylanicum TaxID=53326 RepID=A0A016X0T1_9BILA|nr:hypothetical protein Y032_0420g1143 [Ancylostoma ceylanicum]
MNYCSRCLTGARPGQEQNSLDALPVTIWASIPRFGTGRLSFDEPKKFTFTGGVGKSTQVHTLPRKISLSEVLDPSLKYCVDHTSA